LAFPEDRPLLHRQHQKTSAFQALLQNQCAFPALFQSVASAPSSTIDILVRCYHRCRRDSTRSRIPSNNIEKKRNGGTFRTGSKDYLIAQSCSGDHSPSWLNKPNEPLCAIRANPGVPPLSKQQRKNQYQRTFRRRLLLPDRHRCPLNRVRKINKQWAARWHRMHWPVWVYRLELDW